MASTPTRTAAGNRPHAATTSAKSGGIALDFALVLCSTPGFSRVKPGLIESCPRDFLYARRAIHGLRRAVFLRRRPASCRFNPVPPPSGQFSSVE